jgi:hypothetical protein
MSASAGSRPGSSRRRWWTPWVMIAWNLGPVLAAVLNRRRDRDLAVA